MTPSGFTRNPKELKRRGQEVLQDVIKDRTLEFASKAVDWIAARLPETERRRSESRPPARLVAHRGAWKDRGCLENTIAAFDRARESGVWGLEFDVRFTKDDVAVVHHDETLLRTFGRPLAISGMTLSTLKHEAPEVPTLEEVVQEYSGSMHLFVELKDKRESLTDLRLRRFYEHFSALRPQENYHFLSLDLATLEAMTSRAGIPKNCLVTVAETNISEMSDATLNLGYRGFTCHWLMMTPALIQRHQAVGQMCGIGYASSEKSLRREWARGIDWIFTNHAHLAVDWLADINSKKKSAE